MKNLNLFRKSARGSEGSTLASAVVRPSFDCRSTVVKHLAFMLLFLLGSLNVWGADVTYAQTSTSEASVSKGTAPENSSISFTTTYTNNKVQLTNNNHMTYTLSGYAGYKITAITLSMHSNKSGGSGTFLAKAGTTTLAQISTTTAFNQWYDNTSWSQTDFVSVHVTMTNNDYTINQNENVEITITCPSGKSNNSLYCESITITYEEAGSGGPAQTTVKTLQSIEVSEMTTSYDVGDAFSFDGTCTATYSVTVNDEPQDDEQKTVIPTSVSTPDMTVAGDKTITVTYTEDEVEKSTTYKITVAAAEGDKLTVETTGVTGTSYADWEEVAGVSGAVYAGQSAGGNSSIQLRSKNSNSGIISTTSGGLIKKVKVVWNSNTSNGAVLNVYGSNTAYTAASDLYGDNKGTLLGTIVNGTSTQLEITGDYEYVGVRSNEGAMYLTSITFVWEAGKQLESIAVKTNPDKISYNIGDAFDATGLVITATYDDSSSEDIAYAGNEDKLTITGFNSTAAAAEQVITVTYGGKSTTFNVEIKNVTLQTVTVSGTPATTSYTAGDTFDPTDLTVMGHYSDNSDAAITSGITWSYPDDNATLTAGQTSIRVVATVDEIASTAYTVSGLTVAAAPLVASWVASEQGYENQQAVTSATFGTSNAFTITFDKGTNSNAPKYYTSGTAIRAYGGNTFVLSSNDYKFTKIVIGFGSDDGNNAISANVGTYEAGTWTGNSKEVTFTIGGTSGHRRIASITVTYEAALPSVETPTISPDGGDFITASQTVTITCATDGAEIHYTLDGTDPTSESDTYTEALSLTGTKTVKAIAIKDGMENSTVATATFTKIDVKTVADALSAAVNEVVYVSGTITSITEVSTTHGNATYVISDIVAGVPTNQMIVYRGKYLNNANFTSVDQLHVGDVVLVKGTISQYDSKNQLEAGNILQSISAPAVAAPTFTPDGGGFVVSTSVSLACVTAGATIYYTTDGTTPDNTKNAYASSAIPLTETTTIKAVAIKNSESSMVVERTFTKTDPMTVAAAYDALDSEDPISNAAVEGIVYKVDRCTAGGNAQYWISDDGTESTKVIEIYNGYGLDGANFADADGIQVGDKVIVFGTLKIYYNKNSEEVCREFDSGSRLLSLTRKTVTEVAVDGTPNKTNYKTGQAFEPAGLTVTVTYNDNSHATVVAADCVWEITPATFTEAGTNKSVSVKATYNEVQSPAFVVENLTVTAAPTFNASDHEWQLVTSEAQLVAGKYYVIASTAKGKVMSNTISSNVAGEIAATFADGVINYNAFGSSQRADAAGVAVLQLGGEEGAWTLTEVVAEDALLGATAAKNIAWGSGTTTWSISIANDNATIQNGTNTYGRILHNVNSTRFTTYTSDVSASMLLPQLYVWAEKTYKLRYDANGGENAPAAQPAVAGQATVTDAKPTKEDYIFKEWNTLVGGDGEAKAAGEVIDLSAGDVILYAQWRDPFTVTISYDANEGTGEMAADAGQVEGSTYTIKANAFEREGYLFAGWKAYAGENELTITNGKFTVPATDVTLKAQWQSATDSKWVLVEHLSQLADGDKVIIAAADYEYALGAASGSVRTNVAVTKTGKLLSVPGSATELILGRNGNDFTFKDGTKYLNWASGNNLTTSDEVNNNSTWNITIENNATTIANKATAERKIQYNAQSPRFAAYTGTLKAVVIYKYLDMDPTDEDSGHERVDLVLNGIGTICLPYNVKASDRFGGVFYMPSHKTSGFANFVEETGTLRAGKAYIFVAENEFIRLKYSGAEVSEPLSDVADTRGLIGTFTNIAPGNLTNKYVIANNKLMECGSGAYLNAYRAYLDLDAMPEEALVINDGPNAAPRRRLGVGGNAPQVATGVDQVPSDQVPNTKVLINGQLYIMYNGTMYNVQGQLVK